MRMIMSRMYFMYADDLLTVIYLQKGCLVGDMEYVFVFLSFIISTDYIIIAVNIIVSEM